MTTIALMLTGKSFTKGFVESITSTLARMMREKDIRIVIITEYSADLYSLKNQMVAKALSNKSDYLMWIDSDMEWKPEDIYALVEADRDIISGVACIEEGRYAIANRTDREDGNYNFVYFYDKTLPANGIEKVDYVGGAFLLVKSEVYNKMHENGGLWYKTRDYMANNGKYVIVSEDFGWCQGARDAGYDIYVHTNVRVGHEKGITLWA